MYRIVLCKNFGAITSTSMNLDILKKRFEDIYATESDGVFRYCFFRTSQREVALDLLQDTFMRFWDALSQNKEIKNDRAFLYTISRNLIIDYYRKKKSVSLDNILEEVSDSSMIITDSKENVVLSAESRFFIDKIEELEEGDRQIIYFRFVDDLKPKEIADILDVTANVVSVRLNRALQKLREITGINIEEI